MTAQLYFLPGVPATTARQLNAAPAVHFTHARPHYSSQNGRVYDRDNQVLSLAAVRLRLWHLYDKMRQAADLNSRWRFEDANEALVQLLLARLTAQRWRMRYGVAS